MTGVQWTTPGGWTAKLFTLEVDQIAAIVILRGPEEVRGDVAD